MKKYKIEVSKSSMAIAFIGLITIAAECMWPLLLSLKNKDLNAIAIILIYILISWVFIRVFFLNVIISNDCFSYNIFSHSKLTIPLNDISFVRLGNESDFIGKGYPAYSKNVIVIEYLSHKRQKQISKKFYLSLKPKDLTSFLVEIRAKCNFVV